MKFIQEYALLIAVATPVAVIVAIQLWLFVTGERGTLLLPSLRRFPSIEVAQAVKAPEAIEAPVIEVALGAQMPAKPAWLAALERRAAADRRVVAQPAAQEEMSAEKAA